MAAKILVTPLGTRRVVWNNFHEMAIQSGMNPSVMAKRLETELETLCHLMGKELVIRGRFTSAQLTKALSSIFFGSLIEEPKASAIEVSPEEESEDEIPPVTKPQINQLAPSAKHLFPTIKMVIGEIEPGERFQIVVPCDYSHDAEGVNWDHVEEIQMSIRGPIRSNVFATLRFSEDEDSEFLIDICCLTE